MKALLLVLGIAALVGGLFFAAQGAGYITWPRESFMVGANNWVTYGLLIAAAGVLLIVLAGRRPR